MFFTPLFVNFARFNHLSDEVVGDCHLMVIEYQMIVDSVFGFSWRNISKVC